MFQKQVHIVFNSKEEDRITKPLLDAKPHKVYYFLANIKKTEQRDVLKPYYEKNSKILLNNLPTLEIIEREVDYTNYIEIIQEISKIIKEEREQDPKCVIYINVSSGSKMTSLASSEASKLWDCETYYIYAKQYDPDALGPQHKGEMFLIKPITFPINKPPKRQIELLKLIDEMIVEKYLNKDSDKNFKRFIYKKSLIDKLVEVGFLSLQKKAKNVRDERSSLYMKSKKDFLILEKKLHYITISDDKRNKKIYLTQIGKDTIQIFKFLV